MRARVIAAAARHTPPTRTTRRPHAHIFFWPSSCFSNVFFCVVVVVGLGGAQVSLFETNIRALGGLLRRFGPDFVTQRLDVVALIDEFASRFYSELDYVVECENGIKVREDMKNLPRVLIPKNYPRWTTRRVHARRPRGLYWSSFSAALPRARRSPSGSRARSCRSRRRTTSRTS